MATEQSHGKARTTLPRSSDLAAVEAVRKPSEGRGPSGRFAAGNRHGVGAGWKHSISKLVGKGVSTPEAEQVARDAWRVFLAFLRAMPNDGAPVRSLAASHARHTTLQAFFDLKAAEAGLTTPEGLRFGEIATKHGIRAERLAVTCLDIATKLSKAHPTDEPLPDWWSPPGKSEGTAEEAAEQEAEEATP